MDNVTLVCTSLNPNKELLNKMLASARNYFDEIILHVDQRSQTNELYSPYTQVTRYCHQEHLKVDEAYNLMIEEQVKTKWVCCFCDDDYFFSDGLYRMMTEFRKGVKEDVVHFKFRVSGYTPPQDKRTWIFGKEYTLCERRPITYDLLTKHNRLPAGSFFRKSAWKKVGGFQGDKMHDWDLWKRMAKNGCTFKYLDYVVYNFVRRENSAWCRQNEILTK